MTNKNIPFEQTKQEKKKRFTNKKKPVGKI